LGLFLVGMGLIFALGVLAASFWQTSILVLKQRGYYDQARLGIAGEGAVVECCVDDYFLPYPGLLPDHPLYSLKMLRDKLGLWFVGGGAAKAEKLLFYSDKRVAAALILMQENKPEAALVTMSKAEIYFDLALNEFGGADKRGENVNELRERMVKANLKHREVLEGIKVWLGGQEPAALRDAWELNQLGGERLGQP